MVSPERPNIFDKVNAAVMQTIDFFRENVFPRNVAVSEAMRINDGGSAPDSQHELVEIIKGVAEELKKTEREAFIDPTSGKLNRNAFDSALRHIANKNYTDTNFEGENAELKPTTIVFLDLNYLKQLNNISYANGGDKAIQYMSNYITEKLRQPNQSGRAATPEGDIFARFGGDEFGIIMQNCTPEEAKARLRPILEKMAVDSLNPDPNIGCICKDDHTHVEAPVQVSAAMGCAELLTKLPEGEVANSREEVVSKLIHLSVTAAQKDEATHKIASKKHAANISGGMPQADDREQAEIIVRAMLDKRFGRQNLTAYPEKKIITDSLQAKGGIIVPSSKIMLPEDSGFNDIFFNATQNRNPQPQRRIELQ